MVRVTIVRLEVGGVDRWMRVGEIVSDVSELRALLSEKGGEG